ncbi:alpha/beta fold hydrolase [Actinoplanes sp. NPDC051470]|uniref:alpha/beta fold hydrolase n=1 Tax=Actinoplanes sp. NPDC051470 TaxID=3157224 RepID=UPI0034307557
MRWLTRADRRLIFSAPRPASGFTSAMVTACGLRLHVRQRPDAEGTPWVLLHGLAVSHRYLMPTAAALPGPVYVPDLPGFGHSAKPGRVFDVAEHADLIASWMDVAGLTRAHVLGNSFGCQVAVELAVRRPDLVASLVLVGPTVDPAAPTAGGQAGRFVRDLLWEDPRQLPMIATDVWDAGLGRVLRTLRHSVDHRIDQRLPLVTAPVLVLRGEHDRIAPAGWTAQAAGLAQAGRTGEIPGAAHNAITTAGPATAAGAVMFVRAAIPT